MRKRTKLTLLSNKWFVAFLVVLFTFIIDLFVAYRWLGLEVFYSNPSYEDSDLRSFYEKISYNSSILELNKEIVIIQTDSIDREGIAELLCKMEEYNPTVIGVDLIFGQSSEKDSALLNIISRLQEILVFPIKGYSDDINNNVFVEKSGSYFDPLFANLNHGFVNMGLSNNNNRIIRYQYYFNYENEKIPSFGYAIASLFQLSKQINDYENDSFLLEFGNVYFRIFQANQILTDKVDKNNIEGKIVILGDLLDPQDIHPTIVGDMVGPLIHAYAINSIINNTNIHYPGRFVSFVIILIMISLFAWALIWGKHKMGDFGNMFVRIIQLFLLLIVYWVGSLLFVRCNIAFNWLLPLSMIAIEAFIFDVINGLIWLFKSK